MSTRDAPAHSPISEEDADSLSIGRIEISDNVIATIASQAAKKINGVQVVGSSFKLSEILSGREPTRRGVSVKTGNESGHVQIDVEVNIEYGTNIYEASSSLQHMIKDEIEALTGTMMVDKVNVRVKELVLPEEEQDQETVSPDKAVGGEPAKKPQEPRQEKEAPAAH